MGVLILGIITVVLSVCVLYLASLDGKNRRAIKRLGKELHECDERRGFFMTSARIANEEIKRLNADLETHITLATDANEEVKRLNINLEAAKARDKKENADFSAKMAALKAEISSLKAEKSRKNQKRDAKGRFEKKK